MSSYPEKVGRYEIRGELGRGAMGRVFRGFDPQLGREVAIKMIATALAGGDGKESDEIAARFLREARVAARLQHPGVVAVFDAGREGDSLYLVMELVEGETLAERLSRGAFPSNEEALEIAAQSAEALAAAHATQIVHRDIKPGNLMITPRGRVKVADFGVAKAVGESTELTRTGMMVGSPAYMAPEQVKGHSLDGRSDLFSLGVVLFEMLLRRKPFPADTVTSLVYQILHEDPMADAAITASLPAGVAEFLRRALAKEPAERIEDATTFAAEARRLAVEPASAVAPTKVLSRRTATTAVRTAAKTAVAAGAADPSGAGEERGKGPLWAALAGAVAIAVALFLWLGHSPAPPDVGAPAEEAVAAPAGQPLVQPDAPEPERAPVLAQPTAPPAARRAAPSATKEPPEATATAAPVRLEPAPPAPTPAPTPEPRLAGTFRTRSGAKFDVDPEEARVTVAGRYLGIADDWDGMGGGKIYVFPAPGEYLVHLELEGFHDAWIKIIVSPEAKRTVISVDTDLEEIDD